MNRHFKQFSIPSLATASGFLLAVVVMVSAPLLASTTNFTVPDDTALRIRLDDTLTSNDSEVGDPFNATVVEKGDYRNARVYGHVLKSTCPARSKVIPAWCFVLTDWLCPPVGALRFTPKSLSSTTHLQARKPMWKGRSSQGVEGARVSSIRRLEPEPALCWVEFSAEVREPESDPSSAGSAVSGRLHSMDVRRSRSTADKKSSSASPAAESPFGLTPYHVSTTQLNFVGGTVFLRICEESRLPCVQF